MVEAAVSPKDKIFIIVLNYNGWKDTIECLESIFKIQSPAFQVIMVDNCSSNNSVSHILDWAEGKLDVDIPSGHPLRHLSCPPVPKPLNYILLKENDYSPTGQPLIVIEANHNGGYAAGNNIGLRYAMQQNNFTYAWLLNNDTVIAPDALENLVKMHNTAPQKERKGLLGTKILYYDNPIILQCAGGARYNKWTGMASELGNKEEDKGQYDETHLPIDYICGASMFVSKPFLEDVGLLCEDYFLYFEEMDWALRAQKADWQLGYAMQAKVYHKEGSSTGGGRRPGRKKNSKLSEFHVIRNKINFTRKFYGLLPLLSIYASFLLIIFNRIRRGQFDRIPMLLKIMLNPRKSTL